MITIQASLSKKIPIVGEQFSSQQASITISAEVTDPAQVVQEAQRLYALAELSVNQQLKIGIVSQAQPQRSAAVIPQQRPSQPFQRSNRSPAKISDSQLRFLQHLVTKTRTSVNAIHEEFRNSSLSIWATFP